MFASEEGSVAEAPADRSQRSVRYWCAFVALGLMFLAVTKGPVFWIRLEVDPTVISTGLLEDIWIQLAFVTSAAVVLALAAPAVRVLWSDRLVTVAFAVFFLAVLASSLWSVASSQTIEQSTMFLLGSAAALAAGAYIRRFDALVALWLAMQVGLGISVFASIRDWPRAFDGRDRLIGIYFHKNSLGPVAMMGVASSIVLGVVLWRRRAWLLVPLMVACLAFDAFVWRQTDSLTPAISVAVAAGAIALLALFVPGRFAWTRRTVGAIGAVALVPLTTFAMIYRSRLSGRLGRNSFVSGRTGIWEVVLDYAAERPIHGWGFMAIWRRPEIIESLQASGRPPVFEAHSGFLEVLLGVGLIGLILLVVVLAIVVARVFAAMWRSPSVLSAWSLGLVVFAVVASVTESFIGPNVLPWVVLCVATGQAVVICQRTSQAANEVLVPDEPIVDEPFPHETIAEEPVAIEPIVDYLASDEPRDDVTGHDLTPLHIAASGGPSFDDTFDFSFDVPEGSVEEPREHRIDPLLDDMDDGFGAIR
jgi:O-antigen ligase